jgi:hypothetical protein
MTLPRLLLIGLGLFVAGAATGRYFGPTKIQTETRLVEVGKHHEQEARVAQQRVRELELQVEHYRQNVRRETVTRWLLGGVVETKITEDINTTRDLSISLDKTTAKLDTAVSTKTDETTRVSAQTKTVTTDRPMNHFTLLGGVSVTLIPLEAVPTFAGQYSRRLAGPFFLSVGVGYTPARAEVKGLVGLGLEF